MYFTLGSNKTGIKFDAAFFSQYFNSVTMVCHGNTWKGGHTVLLNSVL